MSENLPKKISSALISVYHKDGLDDIIHEMSRLGIKLYSTGGTKSFIESLGVAVTPVEELTDYPSIFGGRVKTLHPKVFGGILYRRNLEEDRNEALKFAIPPIDLVVVDLYPFEETVRSGASHEDIIEKIDIGGISLIRAAAKNYKDVVIVPSKNEYAPLLNILQEQNGETTLSERKWFAGMAFHISSHYDTAIFEYFNRDLEIPAFKKSVPGGKSLRYGENPHQKGSFFGDFDALFHQLHGKEISYNNLLDIEAAVQLISEFDDTTFAILKHNNACGLATAPTLKEAWDKALAADPVSAFGGVLICNRKVDGAVAQTINELFFEVIIAPEFDAEALTIFQTKKNRIILVRKETSLPAIQFRSLLNGVMVQDRDLSMEQAGDMKPVTKLKPTAAQLEDLVFANKLVKHTKSNTIVLAKNKQLIASGVGQTSRVDALKQAIEKARSFGFDLQGAVMASDAFFPFPDCVEIAHQAGIVAVVQPGGSVRDQLSIDYCNAHNLIMVVTGIRHFKH